MKDTTYFLPNANGWHTVIFGPSGRPKSMLDDLTADEKRALLVWSEQQPRNSSGAIDMMAWPGWEAAMVRRLSDNKQPAA